ncbi:hypothetical protein PPYR_09658 [Photinus pyralis]|uniref:Mitochondrial fission process protein 1 n=1 Tax=Photinus pyralis TaxID=7054 RepID=A0A1Y1KHC5_PHOPY|nr:mitochondrial fission process protein 1-like [Photinus pyralis]XP_031345298.1 mitochondrial fission process protein 1-like [Photinus pyralis]KAB0791371.1 hypothetical protein PPYR_03171 [Photinus pyralis]KAB0798665.1 hypothetical protein PPYR_09658 [Photinus pyralis]
MSHSGEIDIYRDTPIRYLGYANEIGEAFRSMIGPKWVAVTYGVATTYVLADTASKTKDAHIQHRGDPKTVSFVAFDTFAWQMLASVVVPGITINRTCAAAGYLLTYNRTLPSTTKKWIVTGIGLTMIPFIIKPIDHLIDRLLDGTLRKYAPEKFDVLKDDPKVKKG